ncbi:hypothetical protein D046_6863B, partial [Vibrio parahaemolyticus V-223/04]
QNQKLKKQ